MINRTSAQQAKPHMATSATNKTPHDPHDAAVAAADANQLGTTSDEVTRNLASTSALASSRNSRKPAT